MTPSIAGFLYALVTADMTTPLWIGKQSCASAEYEGIETRITSEVEARGLDAETVQLLLTCGDLVEIEASRGRDGARGRRQVDLDQVPVPARSRVVALAAVELIEALQPPPQPSAKAPPSATLRPKATDKGATTRASNAMWHLGALALADHVSTAIGWIPGLGMEGGWLNDSWGAFISLAAHQATRELTLGQGKAEAGRMDAWIVRQRAWATLSIQAAAGLRVAVSRLSGTASDSADTGKSFWSAWGGPALGVGAAFKPTRSWSMQLRYEVGYAIVSSVGFDEGGADLGFKGVWHGPRLVIATTTASHERM